MTNYFDSSTINPPDPPQKCCKDCVNYNPCPCGEHGWCEECFDFKVPFDSCDQHETFISRIE